MNPWLKSVPSLPSSLFPLPSSLSSLLPSSLQLTPLVDFGTARICLPEQKLVICPVCNPTYLAPEIINGLPFDNKGTDVFFFELF
jgi:hypothetical protein